MVILVALPYYKWQFCTCLSIICVSFSVTCFFMSFSVALLGCCSSQFLENASVKAQSEKYKLHQMCHGGK